MTNIFKERQQRKAITTNENDEWNKIYRTYSRWRHRQDEIFFIKSNIKKKKLKTLVTYYFYYMKNLESDLCFWLETQKSSLQSGGLE